MQTTWQHALQAPHTLHTDAAGNAWIGELRANLQAAAAGQIVAPLSHLAVLRVEGEEASQFLHNLTSNDVKKLAVGAAHWNSFNSPKGRMLASFLVVRDALGYTLIVASDLAQALHKKLSMYVLRAKVKVIDCSTTQCLLGFSGAAAEAALGQAAVTAPQRGASAALGDAQIIALPDATPAARYLLSASPETALAWLEKLSAAGLTPVGDSAWRWLDIQAGIPLIVAATQDEFIAQMVNYELLGGVSFQKGCYPGQEIVARTQYLGKLKKRMYRAHLAQDPAPALNSDLYTEAFGDQSCGKVLSVCPSPESGYDLLAVLQISAYESGAVRVGSADGPALSFGTLPYTVD